MTFRLTLLALLILTACGRPLSVGETRFAETMLGDQIDPQKVRVSRFSGFDKFTTTRPRRTQRTCREVIWPEPEGDTVTVSTAAFVLFDQIFISDALFHDDYLPKYPERMNLAAAMLLGHELVHVWQWQNRDRTGYHPMKAASEHKPGTDPYLLEFDNQSKFLDFPFEQQGAIVEEYICCRTLDPAGGRTKRLHEMLSAVMDVAPLKTRPEISEVTLPWDGAKTAGICS